MPLKHLFGVYLQNGAYKSVCSIVNKRLLVMPHIVLFALLLISPFSYAFTSTAKHDATLLINKSIELKLATSPQWRSLLHYDEKLFPHKIKSFINDQRFFIANNGKINSQEELEATIRTLFIEQSPETEANPHCRFVERERWLRQNLNLPTSSVPQYCSQYHQWRDNIDAHSVSLIFPASYLNSPSSMFGHTFLRFDPQDVKNKSPWLSYSLSYAADVGKSEGASLSYAFKGIAGGFPGTFSVVPYFVKLQEYNALENRDVWEYKLNLKPQEVSQMLDHAWELSDIKFDYYYFRENCAYRILELIDYVRPSLELTRAFRHTAIPASTVSEVVDSGIVTNIKYRPSLGTQLAFSLSQLDPALTHWISRIWNNPKQTDSPEFKELSLSDQHQLLLISNQYATYKSHKQSLDTSTVSKRFALLRQISQFPSKELPRPPAPVRPDLSHRTSLISLRLGKNNTTSYSDLKYRISYHDLLDNIDGYLQGAEIELGDITIRKTELDKVHLQSFDIISLKSLNAWHSLLEPISWQVGVSFDRHADLENNRLSFNLTGDIGKSWPITSQSLIYTLVGADTIIYRKPTDHRAYLNANLKTGLMIYSSLGTGQVEASAKALQWNAPQYQLSIKQNILLAKNHALRLSLSYSQADEELKKDMLISYRYTF